MLLEETIVVDDEELEIFAEVLLEICVVDDEALELFTEAMIETPVVYEDAELPTAEALVTTQEHADEILAVTGKPAILEHYET